MIAALQIAGYLVLIVFLTIALARPVTVVEHIEAMRTVVVR